MRSESNLYNIIFISKPAGYKYEEPGLHGIKDWLKKGRTSPDSYSGQLYKKYGV
jgi:hypothetical protein